MRTLAATLTLAAAVTLAVAAPTSAAAPTDSRSLGGCGYRVVEDPTWQVGQPYHYTGVVHAAAVLYAESDPARPVSATLTCYVTINGVPDDDVATFAGTGAVAGVAPVDYVLRDEDVLQLCERFEFADDTVTRTHCYETGGGIQLPPQEVEDLLSDAAEAAGSADAACDAVRTAPVPQLGRVLRTGDDGDVFVLYGRRVVDCP